MKTTFAALVLKTEKTKVAAATEKMATIKRPVQPAISFWPRGLRMRSTCQIKRTARPVRRPRTASTVQNALSDMRISGMSKERTNPPMPTMARPWP